MRSFKRTKYPCVLIDFRIKDGVGTVPNMFKPSSDFFLLTVPRRFFLLWILLIICVSRLSFCTVFELYEMLQSCDRLTSWRSLVCDVSLCFCYCPLLFHGSGVVLGLFRFLIFAFFFTLICFYVAIH